MLNKFIKTKLISLENDVVVEILDLTFLPIYFKFFAQKEWETNNDEPEVANRKWFELVTFQECSRMRWDLKIFVSLEYEN